jgi:hypothetical protein
MKPSEYLDMVRQALDLSSDYQVAKALQITKSSVSLHRHDRATFDDLTALKVAKALQIPPISIIADMQSMRSKTDELRAFWDELALQNAPQKPPEISNKIKHLTL